MFCPKSDSNVSLDSCNNCNYKLCKSFFCLVVGSRGFSNYELLKRKLDKILQNKNNVIIVSGGAKGADSLAERYAKEHNYPVKIFLAEWDKHGKAAGYIRNAKMHEYINQFSDRGIVAFWDGKSKGTQHNFDFARKYKTPIRIIKVSDVL